MGRYVSPQLTSSNLTDEFADSNSTFNVDGYLTGYTANHISYTNITYNVDDGGNTSYGAAYKIITGWTETNNINNSTQNVVVNYDSTTGRVTSLTIT